MYIVMQSFPDEKIVFASHSEKEASCFFDRQVQHGKGRFELWQENNDGPLRIGGKHLYTPAMTRRQEYEA